MIPQPFSCGEQRKLAVTAVSAAVTFSLVSRKWPHCRIVNYGTKGCQVNLDGGTAVATASADGTDQVYVEAGESVVLTRPTLSNVISAICDGSDSTTLAIHLGI